MRNKADFRASLVCGTAMPELSLRWCRSLALPGRGSVRDQGQQRKVQITALQFPVYFLFNCLEEDSENWQLLTAKLLLVTPILLFHLFFPSICPLNYGIDLLFMTFYKQVVECRNEEILDEKHWRKKPVRSGVRYSEK